MIGKIDTDWNNIRLLCTDSRDENRKGRKKTEQKSMHGLYGGGQEMLVALGALRNGQSAH